MATLFPELLEPQRPFEFPKSLTEKYLPTRIDSFVGISKIKNTLLNFAKTPRPISFCFVGEPGVGKTAMGFALANEVGCSVRYIGAGRMSVDELDRTWEAVNYYPPKGRFWLILADEADQATERAQLHWLSRGDMAASLKPVMGGSFEQGSRLPVIWVFTCNSTNGFEKRFLTRLHTLDFSMYGEAAKIAEYLGSIWDRETAGAYPAPDRPNLARLVKEANGNVRDCLLKLDMILMGL